MDVSWLVPAIQAVESFAKQQKTNGIFPFKRLHLNGGVNPTFYETYRVL